MAVVVDHTMRQIEAIYKAYKQEQAMGQQMQLIVVRTAMAADGPGFKKLADLLAGLADGGDGTPEPPPSPALALMERLKEMGASNV